MVKKKARIQVDREVEAAAELGSVSELPSLPRDDALVLPSHSALQQALTVATASDELAQLREAAATYQDVAKRLKVAKDELVRLAIWRIDVERKLGEELARTVGRGGSGSKFHDGTSKRGGATHGLPDLVKKGASKRYQDLAAIPQEVLQDYLARTAKRGAVPSPGGARNFMLRQSQVRSHGPRKTVREAHAGEPSVSGVLSHSVLEAAERFLGEIDVLVGVAAVRNKLQIDPNVVSPNKLRGSVFVADCSDPASWLPRLAALRLAGSLEQVLVALSAQAASSWFHEVSSDWAMCFLSSDGSEAPMVLAYHGSRLAPFRLVLGELGALARGFAR